MYCPLSCFIVLDMFPVKLPRLTFVLIVALFAGCAQKTPQTTNNSDSRQKAVPAQEQLTIAILPTIDCLPLYVASQYGIFDSLGLKIKTVIYESQMEAEQSVVKGKNIGCATDIIRTALLQYQKAPLRYLFSSNREWELIANKKLRISKIQQLNNRLVGITRLSTIDFLSDYITTQLKNEQLILRPQINNIDTRLQMLENAQIDAAFLPLQRALYARKKGHTLLAIDKSKYDRLAGFAVSTKWTASKENQDKALLLSKGYDIAVEKLRKNAQSVLNEKDLQRFRLKGYESLLQKPQSFAKARVATTAQMKTALDWLKSKKAISSAFSSDTLLLK